MVYFNAQYHLFFQYNPYDREWGNTTWGHAVSKDMVHWKELDEALHRDKFGPVFSGGVVVDVNNTSALAVAVKLLWRCSITVQEPGRNACLGAQMN